MILDDCVSNILEHFPQEDSLYVQERFHADWTVDKEWGWQQNRAIVGHNLKIAWNLTRCGHYYKYLEAEFAKDGLDSESERYSGKADECYIYAKKLGADMETVGVDLARGGIFDAVEREPKNGMPIDFAWRSTKDFWQQEQAILAYYILHGIDNQSEGASPDDLVQSNRFLNLARYCSMFWNQYFLDHNNRKVFFRTTETGQTVIDGDHGIQGGHAIAGYHAFELNFLAHLYIRSFVNGAGERDNRFSLSFCPRKNGGLTTLNVLPDFMPPGQVKVVGLRVNGMESSNFDENFFQIDISAYPEDSKIEVIFEPKGHSDTACLLGSAAPSCHGLKLSL